MLQHAFLNMLLGMGSVFVVLLLICLCIYCFQIFPYLEKRKKERQKNVEPAKKELSQDISMARTEEDDLKQDEAVVAAIMAAITAYTGLNQDEFVVRSIVRR